MHQGTAVINLFFPVTAYTLYAEPRSDSDGPGPSTFDEDAVPQRQRRLSEESREKKEKDFYEGCLVAPSTSHGKRMFQFSAQMLNLEALTHAFCEYPGHHDAIATDERTIETKMSGRH